MELSKTPSPMHVSEFSPGTLIAGRYEIVKCCGSGGWGTVYEAWDVPTKKTVAVKFLHAHLVSQQESLSRFKTEAEASCKLVHPNIVSVHDYGVVNGRPFLVMEYLTGKNLASVISHDGPLSQELFVDCFAQICDALTMAHCRGIIHRDIKPSNIVLERDCRGNTIAKLVDFGMAKLVDRQGRSVEHLTATGETLGTPAYMSPEQCRGITLDERSDLYSLGCVMYEALTGVQPFVADSIMGCLYTQLNDSPPDMKQVAPRIEITPALEAIVLQTLAKDPDKRPDNAQSLRSAILRSTEEPRIDGAWRLWQARSNLRPKKRGMESALIAALALGLICTSVLLITTFTQSNKNSAGSERNEKRDQVPPKTAVRIDVTQKPPTSPVPKTPAATPPKVSSTQPAKPKVIPLPQSVIDDLGLEQPQSAKNAKQIAPRAAIATPTLLTPQSEVVQQTASAPLRSASPVTAVPDGKYNPRYENTIVRGSGPFLWLIKEGWRARIPAGDTVKHLRSQGIPVYSMDNRILNKIPRNFDVDPVGYTPRLQPYPPSMEGVMVQAPPNGPVWLLKNGELHWVPDGETINQLRKEGHSQTIFSEESINLVPHTYQHGQDVPSVRRR